LAAKTKYRPKPKRATCAVQGGEMENGSGNSDKTNFWAQLELTGLKRRPKVRSPDPRQQKPQLGPLGCENVAL